MCQQAEHFNYKNICIFGQGFVGLPLALSFALRGCTVTGVDIDENLVNNIKSGITYQTEKFNNLTIKQILAEEIQNKRYCITSDGAGAVKNNNVIIVTIGIQIKNNKCQMDCLQSACEIIGKNMKAHDLIIIRSTVVPGTTEDFCIPILEKHSNMKAGEDFYVAYASERIAEGKAFEEFANMPTIVGAVNNKSLERAAKVLSIVCKAEIICGSCIKAVETSKVFENVQRDVNIAMSQEFARFTEGLGIDIFEVIKLTNTHKRVNLLTPGPGVGGYCIPNAYHYLAPKAEEMGVNMDLLRLSRIKNAALPEFIVNKTEELLKDQGKELKNSKIAVLGLAMKDYCNDDRTSPSVEICSILVKKGARVASFDPVVPTEYAFKVNTEDEALENADAVLILAKQNGIELNDFQHINRLIKNKAVFIDTKSVINQEEAKKYGVRVWKI
ncbi:MAG: putative capsular polysaccharide biosynthesis protein Cap5O [Clostridiaceae bacterium]|jgi:UDP-N-acetyl-D-mannosaminuronic acid dehydrogenase|nr:putative capsular polysaccharide biosynthesis protein Cap5O [Clostridiaceae bacterium]